MSDAFVELLKNATQPPKHISSGTDKSVLYDVDVSFVKQIASKCRADDWFLSESSRYLLQNLSHKNGYIRMKSLFLIDYLFFRSKLFRSIICKDLLTIAQCGGLLGGRDKHVITLCSWDVLEDKVKLLFELWDLKFGHEMSHLRAMTRYCAESLQLRMPNILENACKKHEEDIQRSQERDRKIIIRCSNFIKGEMKSKCAEVDAQLSDVHRAIDLLFPLAAALHNSAAARDDDEIDEWEDEVLVDRELRLDGDVDTIQYEYEYEGEEDGQSGAVWASTDAEKEAEEGMGCVRGAYSHLVDTSAPPYAAASSSSSTTGMKRYVEQPFDFNIFSTDASPTEVEAPFPSSKIARSGPTSGLESSPLQLPTSDQDTTLHKFSTSLGASNSSTVIEASLHASSISNPDSKLLVDALTDLHTQLRLHSAPWLRSWVNLFSEAVKVMNSPQSASTATPPWLPLTKQEISAASGELKGLYMRVLFVLNSKLKILLQQDGKDLTAEKTLK